MSGKSRRVEKCAFWAHFFCLRNLQNVFVYDIIYHRATIYYTKEKVGKAGNRHEKGLKNKTCQ